MIERLVENAEQRLADAKARVTKITDELRTLRRSLAELDEEARQLALPLGPKPRGLSEKWAAVLNLMLLRSPQPVSIDEILAFSAQHDLGITRATARAQLHHYHQRGLVERVSDGLYVATDVARQFCDY